MDKGMHEQLAGHFHHSAIVSRSNILFDRTPSSDVITYAFLNLLKRLNWYHSRSDLCFHRSRIVGISPCQALVPPCKRS